MKHTPTPEQLDAILPQTQCGLCGYGGCRPYAEAIVNQNEAINRCPPGGVKTLMQLAELMQQDAAPYMAAMAQQEKPAQIAVIRENECIGCTKCLAACPTDAIIGGSKFLHTIIADACTGCGLCLPPCPVDCIDLLPRHAEPDLAHKDNWRERSQRHQERLGQRTSKKEIFAEVPNDLEARKLAIQASLERAKAKKKHD